MMLFAFLPMWPAIGVAAGAIAIPVIIHLINRRRYKIVPWAAMKFLLAAQKQTRKRMRVEQLLLLLCRMAILALVILAMSAVMPWAEDVWAFCGFSKFGQGKSNRQHRVHHVIILDASLSMNQKVEGGVTAFEKARQLALKKIQDNPSGDGYSVLILKDNPTWLVGEASQDARKVSREIENIKPSHGNASLPSALSMIASKLGETKGRFPAQAVYFFTDMQQSTWMGALPSDLKTEAENKEKSAYLEIEQKHKATTVFVDCGPPTDSGNVAVTNIEFDMSQTPYVTAGMDLTLFATVKNFGAAAAKDVRAELLIGKAKETANDAPLQMRVNGQETRSVDAHGQQIYTFNNVKFPAPGTYAVQVKIAGDPLPEDDARTIIITVRNEIPVLLVNGKPSADRFERATEYIRLTLNPFPMGTEPKWMPLRPRVVSPTEFSDMTEEKLATYDCIYWCDVGQFGVNDVRKLDTHLRRGGGFVVTLGDKAAENLDRYNDLLHKNDQGILPAKLMKKIAAPADHHFYFSNSDDNAFGTAPLQAFSDEQDRLTLRTARFRQYVLAEGSKGRTVLSFMPEVANLEKVKRDATLPVDKPAIIEWNPPLRSGQQPAGPALRPGQRVERQPARYRGKVILLTSTANMDWTSWPGSPSFGAMMHELTRLAVTGRLREQSQTVGGLLETYLPGGAEVSVVLKYPAEIDGMKPESIKTQLIDDINLVRWAETDFAGVYRIETPSGHEIPFAVNVPTASADQKGSESDLTRIEETKLKDGYPGWTFKIVRDAREAVLGSAPVDPNPIDIALPFGPDLANAALLLVLGLLFLEIFLAWYFGHYTTTEGALSNAPPGPTSTLVAAVIAVLATILFGIGALIIAHEIYTGDFLGFLPEILRSWAESGLGVEKLQAGEGSRWTYEKMPFLFGMPGNEVWYLALFTIAGIITIFFIYKAEAPRVALAYKLLLGALRLYLILFAVWFLLRRPELHYDREGFPDVVLLIDDTRSMGESDTIQDADVMKRVKKLSDEILGKLRTELADKINVLQTEIDAKSAAAQNDADIKAEVDGLRQRKSYWEKQRADINAGKWRPSRLQLVQAILAQPDPHWIKTLLTKHRSKVHIFHLDLQGRATKLRDPSGDAGELVDAKDTAQLDRTAKALARLEPWGQDSRLGVAVRQVIDHYRGSALSSVIMFTDGVTTRDETLSQAADYAAQKEIALLFIGVGDEHDQRDLKLHDLSVEDTLYLGDSAIFEVRLTGHGYKDLTVPVVLKVKDKTGKEREVASELVKVDPAGKSVRIRLRDRPKDLGRHPYIIEVVPPKIEGNEKPIPTGNLRIERTIEVINPQQIKVLYVEGQPRYEFRFLKSLLEREADEKDKKPKQKSIEARVLLLDADNDWPASDKTALSVFPPTLAELNQYDVLILGDCDPKHKMLQGNLKNIVAYVRGEDEKGKKAAKPGGGLLFVAGAMYNPHRYKGTALADVLPVEPIDNNPPPEVARVERLRPELTSMGRMHPMFRFSPDEGENARIWQNLTPIYWYSTGYGIKPAAEVLAVHPDPNVKAQALRPGQDPRHPLIVQQFVGTGRSMFFGIDESWRWRLREDEVKYNNYWIQNMRYLSRGRSTKTTLRLDRQTPYLVGEKIKVMVQFPDSTPGGGNPNGPKLNEKTEVKVTVTYQSPGGKGGETPVDMRLGKIDGSWGTYEGTWDQTREGKFRFRLTNPDVSAMQPDGEKPSAEALVILPPGELDKLRMDGAEMDLAAGKTNGLYVTLAKADDVLESLPPGPKLRIASNAPPTLLWNQWWALAIVVFLLTSEWVLRKMKHLL
ncbi:MAG: VWA domain-containing protein [Gemmataceae bacterium]|nr:VWA domain-containing protein [Gemmataceae bacterium]